MDSEPSRGRRSRVETSPRLSLQAWARHPAFRASAYLPDPAEAGDPGPMPGHHRRWRWSVRPRIGHRRGLLRHRHTALSRSRNCSLLSHPRHDVLRHRHQHASRLRGGASGSRHLSRFGFGFWARRQSFPASPPVSAAGHRHPVVRFRRRFRAARLGDHCGSWEGCFAAASCEPAIGMAPLRRCRFQVPLRVLAEVVTALGRAEKIASCPCIPARCPPPWRGLHRCSSRKPGHGRSFR